MTASSLYSSVGGQLNLLVAFDEIDLGVGVLQVEALANLLERLVDGVADLLNIHLADNVERISWAMAFLAIWEAQCAGRFYQFPTFGALCQAI